MRLRAAGPADAEAMAAVHATAFEAPWTARDLARFGDEPTAFALAAEEETGALMGFILCRVIAGEAEILTLAVSPPHRRQGVASALVGQALGLASVRATAMFLEVAADNPSAIRLYELAGFAAVGRRAAYYGRSQGGAVDAIVMRRALNS